MDATTSTMQAMQVRTPEKLEAATLPLPQPGPGEVRVRVHACGICHSDMLTVANLFPGLALPRVPGHEIAGTLDALGPGVSGFAPGDRVGIGWAGGFDGTCDSCRRGDFVTCPNLRIPGIAYDGGYADYVIAPAAALARIPAALSFEEAAPLMCAGLTTFNALRHSGARAGDVVAVLGLGGLGHLGVQFAAKMGFATIAIARGADKASFAREWGAIDYIDSASEDVAARLNAYGGARVVLATVTSADAMVATIGGLAVGGTLLVVGVPAEPLAVPAGVLLSRRAVAGWPSGSPLDAEDTLRFAARTGVRAVTETMPRERAQEGYDRMMRGEARFRMVLVND